MAEIATVEDALGVLMNNLLGIATAVRPPTGADSDVYGEGFPSGSEADQTIAPAPAAAYTGGRSGAKYDPAGLTPSEVTAELHRIQERFGVGTAGQYRSAAADAERRKRTGRKSVSDHVGGYAVDITGSPEKLDRVAAWANKNPAVSYVLWRTKDHYDHVHISFKRKK